jgi:hypothetical protein
MSYMTSGVFAAWRGLLRVLEETDWPEVAENPDGVAVWFGDSGTDWNPTGNIPASVEKVVVVPAIEAADQQPGPIGQFARDELFNVVVQVITGIPGRNAIDAANRLEELTALVESRLREILADGRDGYVLPEWAGYQVAVAQCNAVDPLVTPSPSGAIGRAEIIIGCKFRPGTVPSAA